MAAGAIGLLPHWKTPRHLSEFLESIGPWRDFVVIGGGFALFIYKLYLADPKLKNPPGEQEISILLFQESSRNIKKEHSKLPSRGRFQACF